MKKIINNFKEINWKEVKPYLMISIVISSLAFIFLFSFTINSIVHNDTDPNTIYSLFFMGSWSVLFLGMAGLSTLMYLNKKEKLLKILRISSILLIVMGLVLLLLAPMFSNLFYYTA